MSDIWIVTLLCAAYFLFDDRFARLLESTFVNEDLRAIKLMMDKLRQKMKLGTDYSGMGWTGRISGSSLEVFCIGQRIFSVGPSEVTFYKDGGEIPKEKIPNFIARNYLRRESRELALALRGNDKSDFASTVYAALVDHDAL